MELGKFSLNSKKKHMVLALAAIFEHSENCVIVLRRQRTPGSQVTPHSLKYISISLKIQGVKKLSPMRYWFLL